MKNKRYPIKLKKQMKKTLTGSMLFKKKEMKAVVKIFSSERYDKLKELMNKNFKDLVVYGETAYIGDSPPPLIGEPNDWEYKKKDKK